MGQSAGIGYGTVLPTLANTGTHPADGEVFGLLTPGGNPQMRMYNLSTGAWNGVAGSGTPNTITQWGPGGVGLVDSTVTDDATDVVATGGLFTSGTAVGAANSVLLDGNNSEIVFESAVSANETHITTANPTADLIFSFRNEAQGAGTYDFFTVDAVERYSANMPAAYADGNALEIEGAIAVMDAGDTNAFLLLDMNQPGAGHDGAADIIGIDLDLSADDAAATDIGIRFDADYDWELQFEGAAGIQFANLATITWEDAGGAVSMFLRDTPADNAAPVDILELDPTLSIMDNALDVQRVLYIDIDNVDHTNGAVWGIDIDIDTPDAQADETGLHFNGDWDYEIMFGNGGANNIVYNGDIEIADIGGATSFFIRDTVADNDPPVDLFEFDPTLSIMDGAGDIQRILYLDVDNVDHTNGTVYGVNLDLDLGDAQAAEYAIQIEDGWDRDINIEGSGIISVGANLDLGTAGGFMIRLNSAADTIVITPEQNATRGQLAMATRPAAGASGNFNTFSANLLAMDAAGGDVVRSVFIDLTNADHTGGTLYGLDIDGIIGDAQAITIPDGGTGDNSLSFGDAPGTDAQIYFTGSLLVFDNDGAAAYGMQQLINQSGTITFQGSGGIGNMIFDPYNAGNTGFNILTIAQTAVAGTDGNDIINMLFLDWNETDWATATETWNAINIDDITQDAQGLYYGVHVGTGIDAAFYSEGVAHAALASQWEHCVLHGLRPSVDAVYVGRSTDGGFCF
jgi:hypothetical protein